MTTERPCVCIGIPSKGEIKTRTVDNLIKALNHASANGIDYKLIFAEGTVVTTVRTVLVKEFLKRPEFTHLLFIDSDQTFEEHFITQLVTYDKDIIIAPSKIRNNMNYNIYFYDKELDKYRPLDIIDGIGLTKIDAGGMGMMLIKKKILQCIRKIELGIDINGEEKSEDIWFCERARNLGFEIWTDCNLKLGHLVTMEIK